MELNLFDFIKDVPESDELLTLLKNVPRAYDDFVVGTYLDAERHHIREEIIDYIKSHPDDTPSDIMKYLFDNGLMPTGDLTKGDDEDDEYDDEEDEEWKYRIRQELPKFRKTHPDGTSSDFVQYLHDIGVIEDEEDEEDE